MTAFQAILRLVAAVALALALGSGVSGAAATDVTADSANAPTSLADYTLTNWSEEQGPFPFGIYAIAQDLEGYLWLGARTGLVRFDGTEFVVWRGQQALPDDRIAAILAARDGSLWVGFGTVGGVAQIVGGTARRFTAKDGLGEGDVNAIDQDPGGTIWVATHGGLAGFDGQRWRPVGEDEGLPRGPVLGLWRDARSRLWAATTTGLYRRAAEPGPFSLVEGRSDSDVAEDRATIG